MRVQVFDLSTCSAACIEGPYAESALARFAADVRWLEEQGVTVERYNLSQHRAAFAASRVVHRALRHNGPACLPLIVINDEVVFRRFYPHRRELAAVLGLRAVASAH